MLLLIMICFVGETYAARLSGDGHEDPGVVNAEQTGEEVLLEEHQMEAAPLPMPAPAPPEIRPSEVSAPEPEVQAPSGEGKEKMPAVKGRGEEPSRKSKEVKAVKEVKAEQSAAKFVRRSASDKYVTLDFDNVDIGVLVKFISELTGKNFLIDDKVKGKITVMSPKKIPVEDVYKVFLSVLEINGFTVVPAGSMTKIVPTANARERGLETRTKQDPASPEDRMVTQIVSLERANPDEIKRVLDPIIPKTSSVLSYRPAGMLVITDYLSNIRRLQEIIEALDVEGAGDQISYIPLQNASASEVTKSLTTIFSQTQAKGFSTVKAVADSRTNSVILLASGAETENVRKLIAFMDKDVPRGESNIQVYRLQNSNAEDLAKVLTSIVKESGAATPTGAAGSRAMAAPAASVVSKNVQVVPDKATNTLVIMAEREDYKVMESIIRQLDVPRPMVYIEALIMEVDANKDFKLGVEWRGLKETGQISGLDGSQSAAFIGSGGSGTSGSYSVLDGLLTTTTAGVVGAFPNGFALGMVGAGIKIGDVIFPSIGAVIQAYRNDTEVSILSTPQIMTMDNEEAEVNVGSNVPYLTRQDTTSTTTSINYNSYEYKDVGVILTITPHINEEDFVRLKISQQVTKVTSGVSTDTTKPSIPTTLKRTVKTTVVVKDNETVVIGGLVGDSTTDSTYKVPFFGDIPLLGWLFKTKSKSREKTNLYVFLTPHIVRTRDDAAKIYQEKRGTVAEVEEGVIKLNEKGQTGVPVYVPAETKTPANP